MGRYKIYDAPKIPPTVERCVTSFCADYYRRQKASEADEGYNRMIDEALTLCDTEETLRKDLLFDVANCRGYERSKIQIVLSRGAYYNRRRKFVYQVAKGLRLMK